MSQPPLLAAQHLQERLALLGAQASRRTWTALGEEPPLAVLDTLEEVDDPPEQVAVEGPLA